MPEQHTEQTIVRSAGVFETRSIKELFVKIVNDFKLLTMFTKRFIIDI